MLLEAMIHGQACQRRTGSGQAETQGLENLPSLQGHLSCPSTTTLAPSVLGPGIAGQLPQRGADKCALTCHTGS